MWYSSIVKLLVIVKNLLSSLNQKDMLAEIDDDITKLYRMINSPGVL